MIVCLQHAEWRGGRVAAAGLRQPVASVGSEGGNKAAGSPCEDTLSDMLVFRTLGDASRGSPWEVGRRCYRVLSTWVSYEQHGGRRKNLETSRFAPTLPLLGPRSWRPVDPIWDKWVGVVATYQSLFSATDMYLAHATDPGERTLVIFEEVHHAGVESGWGEAAQESFARTADAILCLTGTPFRTDRDHIVFVPNENGSATPQWSASSR